MKKIKLSKPDSCYLFGNIDEYFSYFKTSENYKELGREVNDYKFLEPILKRLAGQVRLGDKILKEIEEQRRIVGDAIEEIKNKNDKLFDWLIREVETKKSELLDQLEKKEIEEF